MAAKSKKTVPAAMIVEAAVETGAEARTGWAPRFPAMSLDSMADFGRDYFAAVAKANVALSEGLQAIGHEMLAYATNTLESASQTATALLGAKTFDEVIRLNSDLAKSALGTMVERSAKLSEMSMSLASETLAPLGHRVEATLTRFARSAAALDGAGTRSARKRRQALIAEVAPPRRFSYP